MEIRSPLVEYALMTHTYLKVFNGRFDVGQWLINRDGYHQFQRLFSVPNLAQAMNAVCMLNGGTRTAANALHIVEEERLELDNLRREEKRE